MAWPRSIRVRYSLRALLVLVTLFALWGGYHSERAWRERQAETALVASGVGLSYGSPIRPQSAWQYVGYIYERATSFVWQERYITAAHAGELSPAAVDALGQLPHLQSLYLQFPHDFSLDAPDPRAPLPDGVLARILGSHQLTRLSLDSWSIGPKDQKAIVSHESLEYVTLHNVDLSEATFIGILSLPRIHTFGAGYCDPSGALASGCRGSSSLEACGIVADSVSPELAHYFRRCPNLRSLQVALAPVDDEFLEALAGHPSLESLGISNAALTDRSGRILEQLPALQTLVIPHEALSLDARRKLKDARQDVLIP